MKKIITEALIVAIGIASFVALMIVYFSVPAWGADNIAVTAGSGETVAFDDISSAKYQRIKMIYGADGSNSGDVSTSNPFPVQFRTSGGTETGTAGNPIQCSLANTGSNGTAINVTVATALPAGSAAIGKLAANSGVDIGDVDVTSIVPGTGATNLGKAEDAAHSSADVGVMSLAVRVDSAASLSGADGDYSPLQLDSSGALRVTGAGGGTQYTEADTDSTITGTAILWEDGSDTLRAVSAAKPLPIDIQDTSVAVTNGGTFVVQENGGALTALQLIDDTVFAEDAAHSSTNKGIQALSVRQDTAAALAGTDADYQPLITDGNGRLHVNVGAISDGSGSLTVDGTVTCNLAAGTNNVGDVDVLSIAAGNNNIGDVDVASSALPTGASTLAEQQSQTTHLATIAGDTTDIEAAVEILDNAISGSEMQVDVVAALPAGTNGIGKLTANSGVDIGDVTLTVETSGGYATFRSIDLDESEEEAKDTAGQVYGYYLFNNAASVRYFKFYEADADDVTVGTTVPDMTLPVPAGSAANVSFTHGIEFSNAITAACTTGVADNDTGAPGANECVIDLYYK